MALRSTLLVAFAFFFAGPVLAQKPNQKMETPPELEKIGAKLIFAPNQPGQQRQPIGIDFCRQPVTDDQLKPLLLIPGLLALRLNGTQIGPNSFDLLKKQVKLQTLHLENTATSDTDIIQLRTLRQLTELDLSRTNITDESLRWLKDATKLEVLSLANMKLNGDGLRYLERFSRLNNLNLNVVPLTEKDVEYLVPLQTLNSLHLSGTKLNDAGVIALFGGGSDGAKRSRTRRSVDPFPRLTILWLGGNTTLTDKSIPAIVQLKQLERLGLDQTQITDEALKQLAGLPNLQELYLSNCQGITDAGMEHLQAMTHLQVLGLNNTKVTDEGIAKLAELTHLRRVMARNTAVTEAGADRLRESLPSVDVQVGGNQQAKVADNGADDPSEIPADDPSN